MKKVLFLLAATSVAVSVQANFMPDAEAAAYLKTLAEKGKNYQRRTDKTYFFSRAQLKYGLHRNDYLRRWCDRPLMQETGLAKGGTFAVTHSGKYDEKGFINPCTYELESKLLEKFNFTGFAFFPETFGRMNIFDHVGRPGTGNIRLLTEFRFSASRAVFKPETTRRMECAARALANPYVFRLKDKVVITSYPGADERGLKYWQDVKADFQAQFGDKFLFMPWMSLDGNMRPSGKNKTWSKNDIIKMEERLRQYLRVLDGFYYNAPPFLDRRYQWEFDREVAIPIIHAVMSEPEFKDKYLAWGTKVGHMNCHVQTYGIDAFNTDTLRGTVGAAVLAARTKMPIIACVGKVVR